MGAVKGNSPKVGQASGDIASTDVCLKEAVIKDGGKDKK